ncbi:MAG: pyrroloquinoline quinone biosynthesis protein PqqB [Proteobacteria bacterium]|nr:pyrroloquinoline quinone biosynthesis protein PqqB [Pseudomonadota bacterium]
MRVLVLGSAAGGGFPQWNCNCRVCRAARAGDGRARPRTQSSLAVSADGERWVLLNASPDLRQQITDNPPLHPNGGARHSPIAAVVLTNADVDHIAGLLTLRESQPFVLYASGRVHDALDANPIFRILNPRFVRRQALPLGQPLALQAPDGEDIGLTVEPFAVPGKIALYLEDPDAGDNFGTREGDTIGLCVSQPATGKSFFYIPGCAALDAPLIQRLDGAPLVLFDGTLFENREMVTGGLGQKTGARMGHLNVSGPDGSMAAFEGLGVGRRIYIHINNSNPVLLEDSPERAAVVAAGWEVAYDGQEIVL